MSNWTRWPLFHPLPAVCLVALVTLLLGLPLLGGLRVDNRISVWLPPQDPDLATYDRFRSVFGEDNFLVVAVRDVAVTREPARSQVEDLEVKLASAAWVGHAHGPFAGAIPAEARQRLVAPDGRAAAILVYPPAGQEAGPAPDFVARTEQLAAASPLADHMEFAGPAAINAALDAGSRGSFLHLFPIVVLLIAAVLWIALRRLRYVLATLLVAGISIAWTLGIYVLCGGTLNMVVAVVPSLLVVLGTAYSLHLLTAYRATRGESSSQRWSTAIAATHRPCLLTALTTAAGLGALASASIPPVRHLGMLSAAGVTVEFFLVFFFMPALHQLGRDIEEIPTGHEWHAGTRLIGWIRLRRWLVLGSAAVVVLAAGLGLGRLKIESHILSFFAPAAPVVRATRDIEEHLFGLTPIELWFHGPTSLLLDDRVMAAARRLEHDCASEPDVTAVFSPLQADPAASGFDNRFRLAQGEFDARATLAVHSMSSEHGQALVKHLRRKVRRSLPHGITARITGAIPILVRIQALLLRTQITTFAVSMALITLILAAAFRSLPLALFSLVPNILPILVTLGVMGYAGIPLDVATVTVASIALGLVVDDTIHILERLARNRSSRVSRATRLAEVLKEAGRPILFTSIATAVGFSAFLFAAFRPTFFFGLLVGFTALVALACDLVLLPSLILVKEQ